MYENHSVRIAQLPTKTRKAYSLKGFWKPSLLTCCADPGMIQRPYPGESLVTRFPGAEDQPGGLTVLGLNVLKGDDEGIIDVLCFRWVCDWNQRSELLSVLNVPAWDRIVKIPAVSDIIGPEFAVGMPLWLGLNADFWAAAHSFWGTAVGVPLSQQLPHTHQTGGGNHSFAVLVNKYLLALQPCVRHYGEKQREALHILPSIPTGSFLDIKGQHQGPLI